MKFLQVLSLATRKGDLREDRWVREGPNDGVMISIRGGLQSGSHW
jgi:hypothetical protein